MKYETFHDIFVRVGEAKTRKEKIAVLQENSSPTIKAILGYTYDPNVVWALPDTDPPYTESVKREQIFITLLESIDPKDAKVVLAMKNRKLPYKGLTRKLVAEAFPTISTNW